MNMILVGVDRLELDVRVVLVDLLDPRDDESFYPFVDNFSLVSGWKYDMIVQRKTECDL